MSKECMFLETMAIDPVYEVQRPSKRNYISVDAGTLCHNAKGQAVTQRRQASREKSVESHSHLLMAE